MIHITRFLAVIPARGGSKSVPRKNIRPLAGRPLLSWTIDQIESIPEIDLVVVSTDDADIAEVALQRGVRVIDRPPEISGDTASTESALLHALEVLETDGLAPFDYIMVLEPTSPFRKPETIRRCMTMIVERGGQSLMTVTETRNNIGRRENGFFRPLVSGAPRRRQDRTPFYVESSTVYIARVDFLRTAGSLVADDWLSEIVSEEEALDINSDLDFRIAESLAGKSS